MDDEHDFTEEEMARLRWIHANPPPNIDRLGPCPDWCAGRPHWFRGDVAAEQSHTSEAMTPLEVETGVVTIPWEPLDDHSLLAVELEWTPFADNPASRRIVGLVYIDGDCPVEMTPDQIRALADGLVPQVERLREFADRLESLHPEDMPDQGDPDKEGVPFEPPEY